MTGTTFAQAVGILAAPVLTRLYSPEDFGVYGIYIALIGALAICAGGAYEQAIVITDNDEDALNIAIIALLMSLIYSLILLFVFNRFRSQISTLLNVLDYEKCLWMVAIGVFITVLFQIVTYWSIRTGRFPRLAVRQFTQSTITVGTQLYSGYFFSGGFLGLFLSSLLGQLVATGQILIKIIREDLATLYRYIKITNMLQVARRYKRFPLYLVPAGLLNNLASTLPLILLGYWFNPHIVGFFALSNRILVIPTQLIGNSISQVFYPKANTAYLTDTLTETTLNMLVYLVRLGIVPFLLFIYVAPELFGLIFGSEWDVAGRYCVWLGIFACFRFISSPLSSIFVILGKQNITLVFDLCSLTLRILSIYIGSLLNNDMLAIMLYGLTGAIMYLLAIYLIIILSDISIKDVFRLTKVEIRLGLLVVLLLFIKDVFSCSYAFSITAGILIGLLYVFYETGKNNALKGGNYGKD